MIPDFRDWKLEPAGEMALRTSLDITGSRLGVGCETLDRDYYNPDPVFPRLGELGVKWARLQTGWIKCERTEGVYDFEWLDRQVDTLLRLGIQPWMSLSYGNPLYTPDAGPNPVAAVGKTPLNSPEAEAAWLRYVQALVSHFRDRVSEYEIWNEPDHPMFWANGPISGAAYARLFEPTAAAVRQVHPKARIVALALAYSLCHAGRVYTREFFEHLRDPGAVDVVTFHSYRFPPDDRYPEEASLLRDVVRSFNPRAELWQGESGYPSQPDGAGAPAHNNVTSETIQAKWLSRHILCSLGIGLERVSWFHASDLTAYGPEGRINPKGLLRTDASPKPSFAVYRRICALFEQDVVPDTWRWNARLPTPTVSHAMPTVKAFRFAGPRDARYMAYWREGDIENESRADPFTLWVEGDWSGAHLLDPLTGTVHRATGAHDGGGWRFDLPLGDSALILADRNPYTPPRGATAATSPR